MFNSNNIILFIKIFVLFVIIDMIWIKLIAENKYKKMIKSIQNEELNVKIVPAIFVYVFMTVLLMLFGSQSNIRNFLLGFLSYGIYDFTNLALINKFDGLFAVADMTWGGILFALTNKIALEIKF
jgi:uncharacterized membrane protein